jgi:peptidoglycan/LPS O-acetylase OafA/YrhL
MAWSALIMLSGLLLIALGVATAAMVAPQSVGSPAFPFADGVVAGVARFLVALLAGAAAWRRLPDRLRPQPWLWAISGPMIVVLILDVTAVTFGSTAWWRLPVDLAVTALGAALCGVSTHWR